MSSKAEDIKGELSPMFQNVKTLSEKTKGIHTSDNEEEPKDNNEEEEPNEEPNEEPKDNNEEEEPKDNNEEEEPKDNGEEEEPAPANDEGEPNEGETRILTSEQEENIREYINETLKRVIKGENMLDNMKSFIDFVKFIPQNILDENIEHYAAVLSNATINGVKLFDDINAARDFINDVKKKRKSRKWLRPKAQKQIKQEIQKNLQISPMMLKNVKQRTNAINIYQY